MSHELSVRTLEPEPGLAGRVIDRAANVRRNLARLAVTGLAVAVGAVSALTVEETVWPETAAADSLGYPDYGMPCEHYPYSVGGTCPDYDWGPVHTEAYGDASEISSRGYAYRNCTDYVAWKESSLGVSVPHNLGNASDWYANAPAAERSSTPEAGDAAVEPGTASNPYGHVAFVESVNAGTITVSEYNHDARGGGDVRTGTPASMGFTEFVDFGARTPGGSGAAASPASAPSVAYNPGNHLPVVVGRDSRGVLEYHYQRFDGSWGVAGLGGTESAPSVAYNPANHLPVVAAEGAGNSLDYHYQKSDGSWGLAHLGVADSAPDVAYNPGNRLPVVSVQGAGRALLYYYQKSDGSWGHAGLGMTADAPSVAYNPANHLPVV
ncbi:MAG: CHAP domain-containing protein, partial [Candidatus Saccharimonadales bacterium]